jgi:hypothetical protein
MVSMNTQTRAVVAVMLSFSASAGADTAQALPEALLACTHEADDARRLACFDRQVIAKSPPTVSAPTVSTPAVAEKTLPAPAADRYGLPAGVAHKPQVLEARVTAVTRQPRGELAITLDNAQVWLQTDPNTLLEIMPGAAVKIVPGALGSFWLQLDSKHGSRVRRLR